MWFTEFYASRIGRADLDGIREFVIPTAESGPRDVVAGPDGNLWFSEELGNAIGRLTLDGVFTEFPLPPRRQPSARTWS